MRSDKLVNMEKCRQAVMLMDTYCSALTGTQEERHT